MSVASFQGGRSLLEVLVAGLLMAGLLMAGLLMAGQLMAATRIHIRVMLAGLVGLLMAFFNFGTSAFTSTPRFQFGN